MLKSFSSSAFRAYRISRATFCWIKFKATFLADLKLALEVILLVFSEPCHFFCSMAGPSLIRFPRQLGLLGTDCLWMVNIVGTIPFAGFVIPDRVFMICLVSESWEHNASI